jgi:hypothetical protein
MARAADLLGDRDVERETRSSVVRFVITKIEEDSTIEAAESLVPPHNAPALAGSRGTQELPRPPARRRLRHSVPCHSARGSGRVRGSATVARGVGSAPLVVRAREELVAARSLRALLGL